jgi:hypothetical protein
MAVYDLIPPDPNMPGLYQPPSQPGGGVGTMPMPGQTGAPIGGSGMKGGAPAGGGWFDQNAPAPSLGAGQGALNQQFGGNAPGGGYFEQFNAPNGVNFMNDPGYQFRIDQGNRAVQNSAFGRGAGLTGGALRALTDYSQGAASQEYGNVFNRALQGQTFNRDTSFGNADRALNSYMASRDTFWGDNDRLFGRNFSLAGLGQNAAAGVGNSIGQYGQSMNALITGQGNANASASIGRGNAIAGGINGGLDAYARR